MKYHQHFKEQQNMEKYTIKRTTTKLWLKYTNHQTIVN